MIPTEMSGGIQHRVKIGTCSGPAEAAFVRSVFDAHEIPVVINGEMHASAMGGLGGFVRLDIFVDQDDAEDALALLRDIREGDHAVSDGDEPTGGAAAGADGNDLHDDPERDERDERGDADGVWDAVHETGVSRASGAAPTTSFDTRRRSTGAVLLLSVMLGFGTAHMSTGAWGRGIAIAALNVVAIWYVVGGNPILGGWLLFGARFADLFGALWRVWSRPVGDMSR
jgi:hypothetical protein